MPVSSVLLITSVIPFWLYGEMPIFPLNDRKWNLLQCSQSTTHYIIIAQFPQGFASFDPNYSFVVEIKNSRMHKCD